MLKAIVRTTIAAGFAYGVYSVARRFWGKDIDAAVNSAVDSAKKTAIDTVTRGVNQLDLAKKGEQVTHTVNKLDLPKKGEQLTASVNEMSRKAM